MQPKTGEKRSRRRLRHIAVLPSLVTLLNAVCGFASIHFAARGMNQPDRLWLEKPELTFFAAAAWMIFFAMFADSLDGYLARHSGSAGSFGGQLDSLADMVSFGIAPAFLMLRVVESSLADLIGPASPAFGSLPGRLLWLMAVMYVCCTTLRLARFNVENSPDEAAHMGFKGLASPAAAGIIASLVLLHCDLLPELLRSQIIIYALPFATVAVAWLMVTRIPYAHVVNQFIRGRRPFRHVVLVVLVCLLLIWKLQLTLAIGFAAYGISGPARRLWHKHIRRTATHTAPDHTESHIRTLETRPK